MFFSIAIECILAYLPYMRNFGFDTGFIRQSKFGYYMVVCNKVGNKISSISNLRMFSF